MPDHDRLSNLILSHWCLYQPSMVDSLRRENLLESTLGETAERMSDRLYELISVHKIEHHRAWEMVIQEFLRPEESSSTSRRSPSQSPLATSG